MIEEAGSTALLHYLENDCIIVTSALATVEVPRAAGLANPDPEVDDEVRALLASCMIVQVGSQVLRSARQLASAAVRTLDAIHLASALRVEADALVAYDRRLLLAGSAQGLAVSSPGVDPPL